MTIWMNKICKQKLTSSQKAKQGIDKDMKIYAWIKVSPKQIRQTNQAKQTSH